MSSLPARRLMAARFALATVVTIVYMAVPAVRPASVGRHRPRWRTAVVAGAVVHRPMEEYFDDASNPFPSPADACRLFAIGHVGRVCHRWADHDLPSPLDTLIITTRLALPMWVYSLRPLTVAEGQTWMTSTSITSTGPCPACPSGTRCG